MSLTVQLALFSHVVIAQAVVVVVVAIVVCGRHGIGPLKSAYSFLSELRLTATGRHVPYGITQCYLLRITNERALPKPQSGWPVLDFLPWRDGRLSWPRWLVTYQDETYLL